MLSPACSSLDMFDDYRARAAAFARAARAVGRMSVVVDEKRYDTALLLACAVLLFIGLTTLFSLGLAKSGNWFYKQFFYALLAIILFIGASRLSVSQWKQAAPYLAIGAIALLLSTLLFGDSHKGASRWIKVD